ncbi:restriction endonuclease [Thermogemmatispora sp.]|uniref:restriction endonuclease n=1 Tax=Thermogemmatispora sp. TaxID=1968838 RepID=UPI0035E40317
MVTMISLIGEQPLPNFLAILHYQPNQVLCLYSKITKGHFDRLQSTVQNHQHLSVSIRGIDVDPYNMVNIIDNLKRELYQQKLVSQDLIFNLTGGTKIMSLAAYQVAQEWKAPMLYLQSEQKQATIMLYQWKDNEPQQIDQQEIYSEHLTLKDILDLHLGTGAWYQNTKKRSDAGARFEQTLADLLRADGYEILQNVRSSDGQEEIDIVVRFQNRYGAIEAKCKRSTPHNIEAIKQLVTSTKQLGSYVQRFYILTVPLPKEQRELVERLKIRTIILESYKDGQLATEDRQKFLSDIAQVLR